MKDNKWKIRKVINLKNSKSGKFEKDNRFKKQQILNIKKSER
jgi:hypothetical protein